MRIGSWREGCNLRHEGFVGHVSPPNTQHAWRRDILLCLLSVVVQSDAQGVLKSGNFMRMEE